MKISFNNQVIEIQEETVFSFLKSKQLHAQKGLAVALNNHVLPLKQWEATPLKENDKILLIQASAGG